ncbi:MAG: helix-turn-helix domain-containing protein, partial [Aeromicrobium sp.]
MFVIGEFARLGRVSVRMLRHYDTIGLLHPARVDDATGYRSYRASQLARLNRIIALKDLGLTLQQVQDILDKDLDVNELYGMLRLRRLELEAGIEADRDRLTRVEARLSIIEREGLMPVTDVVIKPISSVRVAELTGVADGFEPTSIAPVIQGLYDVLCGQLAADGIQPVGPAIGYYDHLDERVLVHAA